MKTKLLALITKPAIRKVLIAALIAGSATLGVKLSPELADALLIAVQVVL